jgi:hypothetical protein
MEELEKALALLLGHTDRASVLKLMHEKAQPLWQDVFNRGHSEATQSGKKDLEKKDAEIAGVRAELDASKAKVKELEGKTPELAAVHDQYKVQITELTNKITALQDAEKSAAKANKIAGIKEAVLTKLKSLKVNETYAKALLRDPDVESRITLTDDGSPMIMQKGKTIPIIAADGTSPADVFAEELFQGVPNELRNAPKGRGPGVREGSEGGGTGNKYDEIRESAKAELAAKHPKVKTAAERLGMTST